MAAEQRHEDAHCGQHHPPLPRIAHHASERVGESGRDDHEREHFQEVGQRARVLERMRGVCVEEAAAVRAELLDGILRGSGPSDVCSVTVVFSITEAPSGPVAGIPWSSSTGVQHLSVTGERRHFLVTREVLNDALGNEHQRQHERQRHEQIESGTSESTQKFPTVRGCAARVRESTRWHGDARGRGKEVLDRKPRRLREIAHRRFARIALPVRVGREADGRVECRIRRDGAEALRVQRQPACNRCRPKTKTTPMALNSSSATA